uniref:Leukemia inhibitory factor n=1 Tax=Sphenodon punctatus TaxID=8508 RepID=A0A8D0HU69_SPHPU
MKVRETEAQISGVVPLLLALYYRCVSGKPLPVNSPSPLCNNIHSCKHHHVYKQVLSQVARLNMTAQDLFNTYLTCQGAPFSTHLDDICNPNDTYFPAFAVNRTSTEKEIMVALYKVFAFLNASLGNITRDQHKLNPKAENLRNQLINTTKTTRGLISNLTCLLCSTKYNVSQVDVTYG